MENINDFIKEYKKRNHIYDEKVDLNEHLPKILSEYITTCDYCRHKYIKAMNAYCPFRTSALNANGFCEHGLK